MLDEEYFRSLSFIYGELADASNNLFYAQFALEGSKPTLAELSFFVGKSFSNIDRFFESYDTVPLRIPF